MIDWSLKRYWIFDMDGTLTRPVHDFDHIRAELGLAPDEDILRSLAALPQPQRRRQYARLDQLELQYAARAQAAPDVTALLAVLAERGCCLGVLTRNSRTVALGALKAIGAAGYFAAEDILGRDEARPKPDPHGIERLLARWSGRAEEAVMVGDFRHDLEAGRASGISTVHVDHGIHEGWPELTDLRITSFSQLIEII